MLELKKDIRENLEENFINDMESVQKEMSLLNLLLASFTDKSYAYDEYCRLRMKFEIEACDFLDLDYNREMEMTDQERLIIQNKAVRRTMSNPGSIYEEVVEEEFVKWQLEKYHKLDKNMYSQISYQSSMNLIKEKVSPSVWVNDLEFFKDICVNKSDKVGQQIADAKQELHEQEIRSSMM